MVFRCPESRGRVLSSFCCLRTATPQPLPFTYVWETLPEGSLEVEQYVDYTPLKTVDPATGSPTYVGVSQFQTEFEYGITD